MEPYCAICVTKFTAKHVPYMLSCSHLVCPNCLPNPTYSQPMCPICSTPGKKEEIIPAYDVLDVILSTRIRPLTVPQLWETVNKAGVPCWELMCNRRCPEEEKCLFSHDPSVLNQAYERVTSLKNTQPVSTEQGWRCRCQLTHLFEEQCDSCFMQL